VQSSFHRVRSPCGAHPAWPLFLRSFTLFVLPASMASCGGDEFSRVSVPAQDASATGGSAGSSNEAGLGGSTSHGGAAGSPAHGGSGAGGASGAGGGCEGGGILCYRDADGDGYGDPTVTDASGCTSCPTGYVSNNTDCNDVPTYGSNYHPGQTNCFPTDLGGGWDYNCNGSTDPSSEGCAACGVASANLRWCDGDCTTQVFKLVSNYSACGVAGQVAKLAQTCGDAVDCGGSYPLTNNVGKGACLQNCK
jgi:hypothetical protein